DPASRVIESELRKRNSDSGASAGMEFRKRNSKSNTIRQARIVRTRASAGAEAGNNEDASRAGLCSPWYSKLPLPQQR
ncbi:hypothetical protein, partial [Streptomyces zaomyceticus]|uniref:hypothetical protein n=1 Tax=Streptomyces zaomyceticus TaxID=68286 RepID=UPI002E1100F2